MWLRLFMRCGLLAGTVGLLSTGAARAQLRPDSARLVLKAGLASLLRHEYEIQAEYRLGNLAALTLTPRVVAGQVPSAVSNTAATAGDQVRGYGLGIGPRLYIPGTRNPGVQLGGLYLGLQAAYQQLRLSYQQLAWGEDPAPDGLRYYVFRERDFSEIIERYGGIATLGYQGQVFHPRLRLDASASLNRFQSRSSAEAASRYSSAPGDYAHSGGFLSLGLSLGFSLR